MNNKIGNMPMDARHVILVEGRDDRVVVEKILRRFEITGVTVADLGSVENVLKKFAPFLKASSAESVGVVVDANTNLEHRWQAIGDRIDWKGFGVDRVRQPSREGMIIQRDSSPGRRQQRLGVWLMPDNETHGKLEEFLNNMIPREKPWELAIDYVERAKQAGLNFDGPKAEIHAWMAIVLPGNLSGTAIDAGIMKLDGEVCRRFIDWVQRLCK